MHLRRLLIPVALTGTIAAGVAEELLPASPAGAGTARATAAKTAKKTSLTGKVVTAAKAFKASLSASQQAAMQFSLDDAKKQSGWSNLPVGAAQRYGVRIQDLTDAQKAKLGVLLKTMLSAQGLDDEQATRQADTYLASQQGSGGGQGLQYGEGLYYVAYYGTPSRSKKWTIQFGGHHLAIHMTYSGTSVSNTPYFVGVEPRTAFTVNGRTYQPMKDEADALFGAVRSLSASQLAQAKLGQSFDDVLVGPGKDGQFPAKQGVTVSTLSAAQRALVTAAIKAYVADMPASIAKKRVKQYKKQYAQTKLAYSGTPDGTTSGGYVRIHGPRVWIEIATQNGVVIRSQTHYHSIERDIKTDYGAGT